MGQDQDAKSSDIWGPADGLHLDTGSWDLKYGNPDAGDGSGFFIGGAGEEGARWSTTGGGFTGSVHDKGLDSQLTLGDFGAHATADFGKKEGDIAFSDAGTSLFDL